MAWNLFGWNIKRAADDQEQQPKSFAPPQTDDGAAIIQTPSVGGGFNTLLDLDGTIKLEAELVTKYRAMCRTPEVDKAVTEIVNEAIIIDDTQNTVELNLEKIEEFSDPIKEVIEECFEEVLLLLEWNTQCYEIFKRWYVDGRLYYHAVIDPKAIKNGLQELRFLDPKRLKKIKEIKKVPSKNGVDLISKTAEYYIYNEKGFDNNPNPGAMNGPTVGVKIAPDAIIFASSGLLNENCTMVLSYLDKAMRYLNMFRTIQDAAVIYRLVRAPQRRVFYVDVGNLSKGKAEEVLRDMMVKQKNKLNYNAETGQIADSRKFTTMLEDYWLSRRGDGSGTKIENLDGAADWGIMPEVQHFLKMLYTSLNVPIGRLDSEMAYSIGKASEITREEVSFTKFIDRLRSRFAELFLELLERQLVLKGVMPPEEFDAIRHKIKFKWGRDSRYAEMSEAEIRNERFNSLVMIQPFIGQLISNEEVRRTILKQSDEDIKRIDEQIMQERESPIYMAQVGLAGEPLPPGQSAPMGAEPQDQAYMPPEPEPKKNNK